MIKLTNHRSVLDRSRSSFFRVCLISKLYNCSGTSSQDRSLSFLQEESYKLKSKSYSFTMPISSFSHLCFIFPGSHASIQFRCVGKCSKRINYVKLNPISHGGGGSLKTPLKRKLQFWPLNKMILSWKKLNFPYLF